MSNRTGLIMLRNHRAEGRRRGVVLPALRAAAPRTLPIGIGFVFLAASYGVLMATKGFSFVWPMCMALFIFTGSMEFVTVDLLLSAFNPVVAFSLAIMAGARHLFYGLAMLGRFKGLGWKRPFLIFGMCDETFVLNVAATIPDGIDRGWYYLWTTWLNQTYWVTGATLGGLIGAHLPFDTDGLGFVLTALFAVLFLDQWRGSGRPGRAAALVGVVVSVAALALFGPDRFIIPALVVIVVFFLATRRWFEGNSDGGHEKPAGMATEGDESR